MGPTASGKSKLALQLAQALKGQIISVDSSLVYRDMDIGTAKPSHSERSEIPHFLIDIIDPKENFSVGQFRKQAIKYVHEIQHKDSLPILVGGTMLYFNSLFFGLAALPEANPIIRHELDEQAKLIGWAKMHQNLQKIDPVSADRIHPNDPQRIQRALEIFFTSGITMTTWLNKASKQPLPFRPIPIIVAPDDRAVLHTEIARRFNEMLDQGLVKEVEHLYQRGDLSSRLPSIRSVGYRQVWEYLAGQYDYPTMVNKAIIATRQLAKRQLTWLRKMPCNLKFSSYDRNLFDNLASEILSQVKKSSD